MIDTGTRELDLCVELPGASVSGIDFVRLAAQQHGFDYSLGFGGAAVCRLAGVGPDGGDCFADYPDFWGLWLQQGGGWVWSSTGAASIRLSDGDIEGWSWGSGDGPATHQKPSSVTAADVCGAAETPPPPTKTAEPQPPASVSPDAGTPRPSVSSPTGGAVASPHGTRTRTPSPSPSEASTSTATSSPASELGGIAAAAARDSGNGPPGAGIAAVGVAAVLLVGGSLVLRRRGRRAS